MTKKDRLEALISYYGGGKPTQFAKLLGLSPSTVSSWVARESMDYDLIFAKCENLSSEWLLAGRGEMIIQEPPKPKVYSVPQQEEEEEAHAYFDVDFVGGFDETFNTETETPAAYISVPGFERADFWCNVRGSSMEPLIKHGDLVALKEVPPSSIRYGEVYAVVMPELRTIKKIRRAEAKEMLRFVPINTEEYDEQEYPKSNILRVFEVMGTITKFF